MDRKSKVPIMPDTLRPPSLINTSRPMGDVPTVVEATTPDRPTPIASLDLSSLATSAQTDARAVQFDMAPRDQPSLLATPLDPESESRRSPSVEIPGLQWSSSRPSLPPPSSMSSGPSSICLSQTPGPSLLECDNPVLRLTTDSPKKRRSLQTPNGNRSIDHPTSIPLYDSPCEDYGSVQDWPSKSEVEAKTSASLQYLNK